MTQSQCPILFVSFNLSIYFQNSNVLVIDWFQWLLRLKGKSHKTFDIIICTKSVFLKFRFWGVWGAAARQTPLLPWVRPCNVPILGRITLNNTKTVLTYIKFRIHTSATYFFRMQWGYVFQLLLPRWSDRECFGSKKPVGCSQVHIYFL